MHTDTKYMKRALQLARRGMYNAAPNPMVGAVIVAPDGRIIGEGYHRRCGEAHAEVNAIASVTDKQALADSTMYVTLEPCAHHGRTGPCADLIVRTGIPRVVVGTPDPFEKVDGKGIDKLRAAGVEVKVGMLEYDCRALNAIFFTAHTLHRPFIALKWAQSGDGYLDIERQPGEPAATISCPVTQLYTHRMRSLYDAILVGSGTVITDNPRLDNRLWIGHSPRPVMLDRRGRVPADSRIMQRQPIVLSGSEPLPELMGQLYEQGITSVMVEGGSQVLQSFIDARLWDFIRVETGPVYFGDKGRAPAPEMRKAEPVKIFNFEGHTVRYYAQNPLVDVKNL